MHNRSELDLGTKAAAASCGMANELCSSETTSFWPQVDVKSLVSG